MIRGALIALACVIALVVLSFAFYTLTFVFALTPYVKTKNKLPKT